MKFSTDEKPAPIWKVPVARSVTSMLTSILIGIALLRLGRQLDLLEEAERLHQALRAIEPRLVVELALVDAQLAADDLVARLGVAADVDAPEVDLVALLHLEGDVDGALVGVDGGERLDVDVGVAGVLVEVVELLDVVAELASG